jgi:hypothetical protein
MSAERIYVYGILVPLGFSESAITYLRKFWKRKFNRELRNATYQFHYQHRVQRVDQDLDAFIILPIVDLCADYCDLRR